MKKFADGWIQLQTEYLQLCGLPLWLHAFADGDGIVLLDSGVSGTPERSIRSELAAAGLRIEDITLVVNSHAHPDHMGGNSALDEISSPVFAGPAAETEWLEDNEALIRGLWEPSPDAYILSEDERSELRELLGPRVRVERLLRDGDEIALSDARLQVVTTSGHSPGHIAVRDADRGLLFTFDDVQGLGTPIAHRDQVLAPLYHDVDRYRSGLRRLQEMEFSSLIPSHGQPLDHDAGMTRLADSLAFVDTAEDFVSDYLHRHTVVRLRELADALGTKLGPYGGVNLQTISVAKAHLDHLVRTGDAATYWRSTGTHDQREGTS